MWIIIFHHLFAQSVKQKLLCTEAFRVVCKPSLIKHCQYSNQMQVRRCERVHLSQVGSKLFLMGHSSFCSCSCLVGLPLPFSPSLALFLADILLCVLASQFFFLGNTAIHGKSPGRRRSNTLPSYVQFSDAFAAARRLGLHVQARQSPYPKSNQQRYPVPDFLVDWDVSQYFRLCTIL